MEVAQSVTEDGVGGWAPAVLCVGARCSSVTRIGDWNGSN